MSSTSRPALVCRGLRRPFDGVPAVDDAGLAVQRGRLIPMLGSSSCAKTAAQQDVRVDAVSYVGHDQVTAPTLPEGTRIRCRQGPGSDSSTATWFLLEMLGPVLHFPAGALQLHRGCAVSAVAG